MIELGALQKANVPERLIVTEHARQRLIERNIKIKDVRECIHTGEIIEQYPEDTPFPSCLVSGTGTEGNILHVVVSMDSDGYIHLITAYAPSTDKWEPDFKTRKERS